MPLAPPPQQKKSSLGRSGISCLTGFYVYKKLLTDVQSVRWKHGIRNNSHRHHHIICCLPGQHEILTKWEGYVSRYFVFRFFLCVWFACGAAIGALYTLYSWLKIEHTCATAFLRIIGELASQYTIMQPIATLCNGVFVLKKQKNKKKMYSDAGERSVEDLPSEERLKGWMRSRSRWFVHLVP